MEYDIIISGSIGSWDCLSPEYVRWMLAKSKDKEVHVGFCSLGGYVKDGLELYHAFKQHGNVHAHAFGLNASMSTIAMLGCETIDIAKGSMLLIHNVSVMIDKWEQCNKEKLDAYIKELQAEKDNLRTFDDVLADMYSERNGKTREENLAQMKLEKWMTADQAVEFGIVDNVTEDKEEEVRTAAFKNLYSNSYSLTRESGIPPLPTAEVATAAAIADGDGNPTEEILRKTWQGIRSLFSPKNQASDKPKMNKKYKNILLAMGSQDGLPADEQGNLTMTEEQAEKLDGYIASLREQAEKATADAEKSENALDAISEEVKELKAQVEELKAAPGDKSDDVRDDKPSFNILDVYNSIKEV